MYIEGAGAGNRWGFLEPCPKEAPHDWRYTTTMTMQKRQKERKKAEKAQRKREAKAARKIEKEEKGDEPEEELQVLDGPVKFEWEDEDIEIRI